MKIASKGVCGFVRFNDNRGHFDAEMHGRGITTYIERAQIARDMGITLIDLPMTHRNAQEVSRGGAITTAYWNGHAMESITVPIDMLRVVYDYVGANTAHSDARAAMNQALTDSGVEFVNGPNIARICNDKWETFLYLRQADISTPSTVPYSLSNATSMLAKTNFIFIKDRTSAGGLNQFAVLLDGKVFVVKSQDGSLTFDRHEDALRFIDGKIEGDFIVQQRVAMPKIDGRVYHFRAMLQRDGTGEITMPLIYMSFGAQGSYQSNAGSLGYARNPNLVYVDFAPLRRRIASMTTQVVRDMQRTSNDNLGEAGFDVLVSPNDTSLSSDGRLRYSDGELTILEVNETPGTATIRNHFAGSLGKILGNPVAFMKHLMQNQTTNQ